MQLKPGDLLEHTWNDHQKPIKVLTVRRRWVRAYHPEGYPGIALHEKKFFKIDRQTLENEFTIKENGLERARRLARSLQKSVHF